MRVPLTVIVKIPFMWFTCALCVGVAPSTSSTVSVFHFACCDDGRDDGVSTNSRLCWGLPATRKIWIVLGWLTNYAASGISCPWLLCVLALHVSWWSHLWLSCLFALVWVAADGPSPPEYFWSQPFSCVHVQGTEFGFGGRRHDCFDYWCLIMNCSVVCWIGNIFG